MARVHRWSVLFRGLEALGLLRAPVYPLLEESGAARPDGGPPDVHPEGWTPQQRAPAEEQEHWAQIRTAVM